jgi:hypothetical protein
MPEGGQVANAPNPAGQALLSRFFDGAVSRVPGSGFWVPGCAFVVLCLESGVRRTAT